MGMYLKVILIILGFLAILYGAAMATKFIGSKYGDMRHSKYIKVIDRFMLNRDGWIYIVQIGDKYLAIGVTANSIRTLGELESRELSPIEGEDRAEFMNLIDRYRMGSYFKRGNGEDIDEEE